MRVNNWLAVTIVLVFATSCGENSTKEKEITGDTAISTTTTVPLSEPFPVPEPVKTTFQEKYPEVKDATWSRYEPVDRFDWTWAGWPAMDTSDYMVRFNWDGSEHWAWYDDSNNWIGTVTTVTDYAGLPAAVNKVITTDYAGYTIVAVDKENDKNRTAYEVDLTKGEDKMTLLIDENGSVMKKKSTVDGQSSKEKNN